MIRTSDVYFVGNDYIIMLFCFDAMMITTALFYFPLLQPGGSHDTRHVRNWLLVTL